MNLREDQLVGLRAFGYTEVEARFLYLVATHSGYFTVRQFLDFAHAKSGSAMHVSWRGWSAWVMPAPGDTLGGALSTTSPRGTSTPRSVKIIFVIGGSTNSRTSKPGS